MKVLLIEDEIKAVQSLTKGLQEQQIEVDYALDGSSGCELALKNQYDVIVSDIIVPGMDGFILTQEIRSKGVKTPVLLLTALNATDDKVLGLEAGADDYLIKPFSARELLARVHAHLEAARKRREAEKAIQLPLCPVRNPAQSGATRGFSCRCGFSYP